MVVSKNKKAKESLRKYLQRENAALLEATKSIKMIPFFACNMHVKHACKNMHVRFYGMSLVFTRKRGCYKTSNITVISIFINYFFLYF
jgi:hypothetical protein